MLLGVLALLAAVLFELTLSSVSIAARGSGSVKRIAVEHAAGEDDSPSWYEFKDDGVATRVDGGGHHRKRRIRSHSATLVRRDLDSYWPPYLPESLDTVGALEASPESAGSVEDLLQLQPVVVDLSNTATGNNNKDVTYAEKKRSESPPELSVKPRSTSGHKSNRFPYNLLPRALLNFFHLNGNKKEKLKANRNAGLKHLVAANKTDRVSESKSAVKEEHNLTRRHAGSFPIEMLKFELEYKRQKLKDKSLWHTLNGHKNSGDPMTRRQSYTARRDHRKRRRRSKYYPKEMLKFELACEHNHMNNKEILPYERTSMAEKKRKRSYPSHKQNRKLSRRKRSHFPLEMLKFELDYKKQRLKDKEHDALTDALKTENSTESYHPYNDLLFLSSNLTKPALNIKKKRNKKIRRESVDNNREFTPKHLNFYDSYLNDRESQIENYRSRRHYRAKRECPRMFRSTLGNIENLLEIPETPKHKRTIRSTRMDEKEEDEDSEIGSEADGHDFLREVEENKRKLQHQSTKNENLDNVRPSFNSREIEELGKSFGNNQPSSTQNIIREQEDEEIHKPLMRDEKEIDRQIDLEEGQPDYAGANSFTEHEQLIDQEELAAESVDTTVAEPLQALSTAAPYIKLVERQVNRKHIYTAPHWLQRSVGAPLPANLVKSTLPLPNVSWSPPPQKQGFFVSRMPVVNNIQPSQQVGVGHVPMAVSAPILQGQLSLARPTNVYGYGQTAPGSTQGNAVVNRGQVRMPTYQASAHPSNLVQRETSGVARSPAPANGDTQQGKFALPQTLLNSTNVQPQALPSTVTPKAPLVEQVSNIGSNGTLLIEKMSNSDSTGTPLVGQVSNNSSNGTLLVGQVSNNDNNEAPLGEHVSNSGNSETPLVGQVSNNGYSGTPLVGQVLNNGNSGTSLVEQVSNSDGNRTSPLRQVSSNDNSGAPIVGQVSNGTPLVGQVSNGDSNGTPLVGQVSNSDSNGTPLVGQVSNNGSNGTPLVGQVSNNSNNGTLLVGQVSNNDNNGAPLGEQVSNSGDSETLLVGQVSNNGYSGTPLVGQVLNNVNSGTSLVEQVSNSDVSRTSPLRQVSNNDNSGAPIVGQVSNGTPLVGQVSNGDSNGTPLVGHVSNSDSNGTLLVGQVSNNGSNGTPLVGQVSNCDSNGTPLVGQVSNSDSNGTLLVGQVSNSDSNGTPLVGQVSNNGSNGTPLVGQVSSSVSNGTPLVGQVSNSDSNGTPLVGQVSNSDGNRVGQISNIGISGAPFVGQVSNETSVVGQLSNNGNSGTPLGGQVSKSYSNGTPLVGQLSNNDNSGTPIVGQVSNRTPLVEQVSNSDSNGTPLVGQLSNNDNSRTPIVGQVSNATPLVGQVSNSDSNGTPLVGQLSNSDSNGTPLVGQVSNSDNNGTPLVGQVLNSDGNGTGQLSNIGNNGTPLVGQVSNETPVVGQLSSNGNSGTPVGGQVSKSDGNGTPLVGQLSNNGNSGTPVVGQVPSSDSNGTPPVGQVLNSDSNGVGQITNFGNSGTPLVGQVSYETPLVGQMPNNGNSGTLAVGQVSNSDSNGTPLVGQVTNSDSNGISLAKQSQAGSVLVNPIEQLNFNNVSPVPKNIQSVTTSIVNVQEQSSANISGQVQNYNNQTPTKSVEAPIFTAGQQSNVNISQRTADRPEPLEIANFFLASTESSKFLQKFNPSNSPIGFNIQNTRNGPSFHEVPSSHLTVTNISPFVASTEPSVFPQKLSPFNSPIASTVQNTVPCFHVIPNDHLSVTSVSPSKQENQVMLPGLFNETVTETPIPPINISIREANESSGVTTPCAGGGGETTENFMGSPDTTTLKTTSTTCIENEVGPAAGPGQAAGSSTANPSGPGGQPAAGQPNPAGQEAGQVGAPQAAASQAGGGAQSSSQEDAYKQTLAQIYQAEAQVKMESDEVTRAEQVASAAQKRLQEILTRIRTLKIELSHVQQAAAIAAQTAKQAQAQLAAHDMKMFEARKKVDALYAEITAIEAKMAQNNCQSRRKRMRYKRAVVNWPRRMWPRASSWPRRMNMASYAGRPMHSMYPLSHLPMLVARQAAPPGQPPPAAAAPAPAGPPPAGETLGQSPPSLGGGGQQALAPGGGGQQAPAPGGGQGISDKQDAEYQQKLQQIYQAESEVKMEAEEVARAEQEAANAQKRLQEVATMVRVLKADLKHMQQVAAASAQTAMQAQQQLSQHDQLMYEARKKVDALYTQMTNIEADMALKSICASSGGGRRRKRQYRRSVSSRRRRISSRRRRRRDIRPR